MQISTHDNRLTKRQMVNQAVLDHGSCLNAVKAPSIRNTLIYETKDGCKRFRYHWTDVVTIHPNGDVTLHSGGWEGKTTMARINSYASGITTFRKDWVWYVVISGVEKSTLPFCDGMRIIKNQENNPVEKIQEAIEQDIARGPNLVPE